MKKIFTFIALAFLAVQSFSQTCTLAPQTSCTPATETFTTAANGFSGDFVFSNQGGGRLQTSVGATSPTTKRLQTATLFLAANATSLSVTFDIGGTGSGDVTGVTLFAQTDPNPNAPLTQLCTFSGTIAGVVCFTTTNISAIQGRRFNLIFVFTVTGSTQNLITFDNFGTNASGNQ